MLLTFGAAVTHAGLDVPIIFTRVPKGAAVVRDEHGRNPDLRADWFAVGSEIAIRSPDGSVRGLSKGFASACDPDVSFEGKHILFAGKKRVGDRWSIWETDLEGTSFRQVLQRPQDSRSPIYLSSLFTLDSPEPWFTMMFVGGNGSFNEAGTRPSIGLYSVKLDGTELRRITFNPNGDLDPVQTSDGRVIYAGWRGAAPGSGPYPRLSLFGVNIDGTDQELYGAEQGMRAQRMPCVTTNGLIVFVETDAPGTRDGAGQLGSVRERRPHHSYRPITTNREPRYAYPTALRGNTLLVSRRASSEKGLFELVTVDADTGRIEPGIQDPEFHLLQAKVIRSRAVPDGRSTVVNTAFDTGVLYALNLYESDPKLAPHLPPETVKRVRLIEGVTAPPGRADGMLSRRLLGEAPVEKDGSFHVQVPADTPIELQALDAEGLALATCRWIWVKQKENRGCIGCHEDPEMIPENLYVDALKRPANKLTLPPAQRRRVGFCENVVPILRARCALADCHGSADSSLPMRFGVTATEQEIKEVYRALLKRETTSASGEDVGRYVDPFQARTSFLAWQLLGRDVSRPWDHSEGRRLHAGRKIKRMPPPGKAAPLTDLERQTILEWIDLGAPYRAASSIFNDRLAEKK